MTQEAIQDIIRRQREFFYTGATLNIDFRIEALKSFKPPSKHIRSRLMLH